MRKLFIMTVRNDAKGRQMKLTVERGHCMVREFLLYPLSDIMTSERAVPPKKFIKIIVANMAANMDGSAISNVYFNGDNYRKFMNMG
jgi:hypothetical protein